MFFILRALTVLALPAFCVAMAAGQSDQDLLTLQEAVEQTIAKVEPSIACVLVSRSTSYRRWDPPASSSDPPGHLGRFDRPLRNANQSDELNRLFNALDLSRPDTVPESYGSGIVIDSSGLVLTCAHVVRNATKVYVRLPGGKGSWADIHASDPRSDLAVLRLQDRLPGLRAVEFGDGGKLRKGQFVIGLANPFAAGYRDGSPSATWGIVSNLRRQAPGLTVETDRSLQSFHRYGTLIQTDVRLNLGCSGGALVNLKGELVGVTTALAALTGIEAPGGFAVPVDSQTTRPIISVLARGEEVEYGFLGVSLVPDAKSKRGASVYNMFPNGPAAHAGLAVGDVIVAINDIPIHDNDDLFLQIGSLTAGAEVRLEVERPGEPKRRMLTPVKLAKLYVSIPSLASRRPPAYGGLRVDYASVLCQRSGWQRIPDAVAIREVVPDSPADKIPLLRPDRLITHVNGALVTTPADFYHAMEQAVDGKVELTIVKAEGHEENITLNIR